MTDVLIRGVPEETVEILKRRAKARNRSLQGELRALLEESAVGEPSVDGVDLARRVRRRIERERGGPLEGDSADMIRDARDAG